MTEQITEPVAPVMLAHVDRLARRRNRVLIALAVVAAAAVVAIVAGFGVLIYSAARDSRAASRQTVGIQRTNRDLLQVVLAATGCTVDDTPDECAAKIRATSVAEGERRIAQVRRDEQAIVDAAANRVVRCTNNHVDVLAGVAAPLPDCPAAPGPVEAPPQVKASPAPAPPQPPQPPAPPRTAPTVAPAASQPASLSGFGCGAALAYLAAHAAPGYTFGCAPHSALGHYGYACMNVPGVCPGSRHIQIACPAPFVYMNEAANSQPPLTQRDPYGQYDARYPCNTYA